MAKVILSNFPFTLQTPNKMNTISQSIAWWCFVPEKLTPEQFVRAVADAGYKGIELVPPEYRPLVIDHGLALSAIGGHQPLTIGLNRRDLHDRLEDEIKANIENAKRLKIPNLICFSGNRNGLDDQAGAEITAEGFARVAPAAENAGVTLALELLNSKVDHPDYQADHTAWGVQVCRAVASPSVKLVYDVYHMQVMEGDIIRTIRSIKDHISYYHTAGNPGRNDLDEDQELFYPAIFRAIKQTGHTGYVTHEFVPKGDPIVALKAAFGTSAMYL
jgi:hydroxypyruvate isomerase